MREYGLKSSLKKKQYQQTNHLENCSRKYDGN